MDKQILTQQRLKELSVKIAAILLLTISLLQIQSTHATPILVWNNIHQEQLLGARNVEVMGVLFDVSFIDGSCDSIWSGCDRTKFRFPLSPLAAAASQALLDQVLLDVLPLITLDSNPWKVRGLDSTDYGAIFTPYAFEDSTVRVVGAYNKAGSGIDVLDGFSFAHDTRLDEHPGSVYARWTVSSTVPEPSVVTLFAISLIAACLLSRYRRKRLV